MNIFDLSRFNARAQENRELKSTNEGLRRQVAGLTAAYEGLSNDNDTLYADNSKLLGAVNELVTANAKLEEQLQKYTYTSGADAVDANVPEQRDSFIPQAEESATDARD